VTQTPSLEGARLKIGHAKTHWESLADEFAQWVRENMTLTFEPFDAPNPQLPWRLHVAENVPLSMSLAMGDSLQCARAALDYLVYELASHARGGKKPKTRTQFPISTSVQTYFETGRHHVKELAGMHRQVIRRLQPYQTQDPKSHPLAILNRFSNQDKHRLLQLTHSGMRQVDFVTQFEYPGRGIVLPAWGATDAYIAAQAEPDIGAVVLADLLVRKDLMSVLGMLTAVISSVEEILDWFEPIF
jgi:hypothetical protein